MFETLTVTLPVAYMKTILPFDRRAISTTH